MTHFVQPSGVKILQSRKVTLKRGGDTNNNFLISWASAHIDQILEVCWLITVQSQGQKCNVCVGTFIFLSCGWWLIWYIGYEVFIRGQCTVSTSRAGS